MPGLGGDWDPNLHPRGWHGRFARKWKVADWLRKILDNFNPHTFHNDSQAGQYAFNLGHKNGPFSSVEAIRYRKDIDEANDHIRAGDIDPETKKFDDMMQSHMHPTTEDLIATRIVGPEAFGLRPDQLHDGPGGITDFYGDTMADPSYSPVHLGGEVIPGQAGPGKILIAMALPAGTKAAFPGQSRTDRGFALDKNQRFTITRIDQDTRGGYYVRAVAEPAGATSGEVTPIQTGRTGTGMTPEARAARIGARPNMPAETRPPSQAPLEGQTAPEHVAPATVVQTDAQKAARLERVKAGRQARVNEGEAPVEAPLPQGNTAPAPAPTPAAPAPAPEKLPEPVQPSGAPNPATGVPDRQEPIHAPAIGGNATTGRSASEVANTPPPPPEPVPAPDPHATFKGAFQEAGLQSPSAGPQRREFNNAYLGVTGGKKSPDDALRELDADIESNKAKLAGEKAEGRPEPAGLAENIKRQEALADLIATHFNQPRLHKKDETPAPTPAPEAPAANAPETGVQQVVHGPQTEKNAAAAARRAATGEQKPTISSARVQKGDVIMARKDENGQWQHTKLKTGAVPITVTHKESGRGEHVITGTDPDGNEVTLPALLGQNVVHRHQGKPAKAAKVAVKKAAPEKVTPEAPAEKAPAKVAKKAAAAAPAKVAKAAAKPAAAATPEETDAKKAAEELKQRSEAAGLPTTVAGLRAAAKEKGIRGFSTMNKATLQHVLLGDEVEKVDNKVGVIAPEKLIPHLEAAKDTNSAKALLANHTLADLRKLALESGDGQKLPAKITKGKAIDEVLRRVRGEDAIHGGRTPDLDLDSQIHEAGITIPKGEAGDSIREEIRGTVPNSPDALRRHRDSLEEMSQHLKESDPAASKAAQRVADEMGMRAQIISGEEEPAPKADSVEKRLARLVGDTPTAKRLAAPLRPDVRQLAEGLGPIGGGIPEEIDARFREGQAPSEVAKWVRAQGKRLKLDAEDKFTTDERDGIGDSTSRASAKETGLQNAKTLEELADRIAKVKPEKATKKAVKKAAPVKAAKAVKATRAEQLTRVQKVADITGQVHELVANDASEEAIRSRLQALENKHGIDTKQLRDLAGDRSGLLFQLEKLNRQAKVIQAGKAGEITPFRRGKMTHVGGRSIPEGTPVRVLRPGHTATLDDGEKVELSKPTVTEAPAKAVKAAKVAKKAAAAAPEESAPVEKKPDFDAGRARTFTPVTQVKQGIIHDEPAGKKTTITAEWGEEQHFVGPWVEVPGADGKPAYGSALKEWTDMHERVPGTEHGWQKTATVDAYQHRGPDVEHTTVLGDGTVETKNTIHDGDWVVRQKNGEVQIIRDDKFRKLYDVPAAAPAKKATPGGLVRGKYRTPDVPVGTRVMVDRTSADEIVPQMVHGDGFPAEVLGHNANGSLRLRDDNGNEMDSVPDALHGTRYRPETPTEARRAAKAAAPAKVAKKAAPRPTKAALARVPEGSVAGERAQVPVDNPVRKSEFDDAWDGAGILEPQGAAGRSMREIRGDISSGKISPEEGIRRMESEIGFNKDDLADVSTQLRRTDLTPSDRSSLEEQQAKLSRAIMAQEKASSFLHGHFGGEKITPDEVISRIPDDPLATIRNAPPDEVREAARQAGFPDVEGDTSQELLQSFIKQAIARERGDRAAKKAAKAAPVKRVPKPADPSYGPGGARHLDATRIGEGLDLDQHTLDGARTDLEAGKTPKQAAEHVRMIARAKADSAAIRHGVFDSAHAGGPPDPELDARNRAEHDRMMGEVAQMREFADRIEASKRPRVVAPKPAKLTESDHKEAKVAAKATGTPVAEARKAILDSKEADAKLQEAGVRTPVDALHQRVIDNASAPFHAATSRPEAEKAMVRMRQDLTLAEIRKMAAGEGITGRSKDDILKKMIDRRFPVETPDEAQMRRNMEVLTRGTPLSERRPDLADGFKAEQAARRAARATPAPTPDVRQDMESQLATPISQAKTRQEAEEIAAGLRGAKLDKALEDAGLSPEGTTTAEERKMLVDHHFPQGAAPAKVAKKAAPAKKAAAPTISPMQRQQEILDATPVKAAKKAAKKAAPARPTSLPTVEEMTSFPSREAARERLAGMTRRPLVDLAKEMQMPGTSSMSMEKLKHEIVEGTVGRRLESEAIRGFRGPSPATGVSLRPTDSEERAAKAATKAARATESAPGPAVRHTRLRDGESAVTKFGRGDGDEKLRIPNGGADQGLVHFDSELGKLWQDLVGDSRSPNSYVNEVEKIGTDVGRGNLSLDDAASRLRTLAERAPDAAVRARILEMIPHITEPGPVPKINVPDNTPPVVRKWLEDLAQIPTLRKTDISGNHRKQSVLDEAMELVRRIGTEPRSDSQERGMDRRLEMLTHNIHESVDGVYAARRIPFPGSDPDVRRWFRAGGPVTAAMTV